MKIEIKNIENSKEIRAIIIDERSDGYRYVRDIVDGPMAAVRKWIIDAGYDKELWNSAKRRMSGPEHEKEQHHD